MRLGRRMLVLLSHCSPESFGWRMLVLLSHCSPTRFGRRMLATWSRCFAICSTLATAAGWVCKGPARTAVAELGVLGLWSSSSHSRWPWGLLEVATSQEHRSLRAGEFLYKAGFGHRTWSRGALQLIAAFQPLEETLFSRHYAFSIWQSGLEVLCFHLASGTGEQLFSTEGKAFICCIWSCSSFL